MFFHKEQKDIICLVNIHTTVLTFKKHHEQRFPCDKEARKGPTLPTPRSPPAASLPLPWPLSAASSRAITPPTAGGHPHPQGTRSPWDTCSAWGILQEEDLHGMRNDP